MRYVEGVPTGSPRAAIVEALERRKAAGILDGALHIPPGLLGEMRVSDTKPDTVFGCSFDFDRLMAAKRYDFSHFPSPGSDERKGEES